jgi:hypothetical protein
MKYIPAILILLLALACGRSNKNDTTVKKVTLGEYCERLSAEDMDDFYGYDFTPEKGWNKINWSTGQHVSLDYFKDSDQLLVHGGLSEFTVDIPFLLDISDKEPFILKYNETGDSMLALNAADQNIVFGSYALTDLKVDPIDHFGMMELKRKDAGILALRHNRRNNLVEIYFTNNDRFTYIPDTIVPKFDPSLDSEDPDALSEEVVNYIRENDSMINKNWYYNRDKEGLASQ